MNGLEVLAFDHEGRKPRGLTHRCRHIPHQIFDELGIVVGALGDMLLVDALEQTVELT